MSPAIAPPEPVTATPPPSAGASPAARPPRNVVVIPDTDWATYTQALKLFESRPAVRVIYDRGRMQIMAPSLEHDDDSRVFTAILTVASMRTRTLLKFGGAVTLRREDLDRGIEGDEVFWVGENARRMAGVRQLDLTAHPPPSLAVEVEVSRSILDKPAIYAAIGVPELWRLDGDHLRFFALDSGSYTAIPVSRSFPFLTPEVVLGVVQRIRTTDDMPAVLEDFGEWVRLRIAAPPANG
jgi:Uma2 family endonuclease